MSTAVATTNGTTAINQWGMARDQLDLLKRTYAAGTTDDEFALFMNTSHRLGLDPFARQVYAIKRGGKLTIQVGIDGFRAVAERTGDLDGQDGPYWCGDDGIWVDAWLHEDAPQAAKIHIYRKGCARPFTGVATLRSYTQGTNGLWKTMPDVLLAKCAESLALRKAFPSSLAGVYTADEMAQADSKHGGVIDAEATDSNPLDDVALDIVLDIEAATSVSDVDLVLPKFAKLPKGTPQRAKAHGVYKAKRAQLEAAQ